GAHAALLGIRGVLARAGDVLLSESLTYPGARSIAAQLALRHVGIAMDDEGLDANAFADACARLAPRALYVNPTLLNPTTHTISQRRRVEIVGIARRFGVAIVEDDPYGFLPGDGPAPFAALAPDITWHVAGLAKCLGAGLRIAYVVAPDVRAGWVFASSVRTATLMASPVTIALATRWITDGTADAAPGRRAPGIDGAAKARQRHPATPTAPTRSDSTFGFRCRNHGPGRLSPV